MRGAARTASRPLLCPKACFFSGKRGPRRGRPRCRGEPSPKPRVRKALSISEGVGGSPEQKKTKAAR
eukprot:6313081-Heterocapsa_arctica.AAC.1